MFDIGWPELLLVMAVALIVIGPKELPNAIRTVTTIVRKLRVAAREFQNGLDDIARESGMDEVKRQFDGIEYYDPGEALKNIAESDKDLLDLEDDPLAANSILDPAKRPGAPVDSGAGDSGDDAAPTEPADSASVDSGADDSGDDAALTEPADSASGGTEPEVAKGDDARPRPAAGGGAT